MLGPPADGIYRTAQHDFFCITSQVKENDRISDQRGVFPRHYFCFPTAQQQRFSRERMRETLNYCAIAGPEDLQNFCERHLNHFDRYWTFLRIDGVEPTNNIRPPKRLPSVAVISSPILSNR